MSSAVLTEVGSWLLQTATALWTALGGWGFLGFAVICFPIIKRLVRLFRSLVNTIN